MRVIFKKLKTKKFNNFSQAGIILLSFCSLSLFLNSEISTKVRGFLKAIDTDNNSLGAGVIVNEDFTDGSFNPTIVQNWRDRSWLCCWWWEVSSNFASVGGDFGNVVTFDDNNDYLQLVTKSLFFQKILIV